MSCAMRRFVSGAEKAQDAAGVPARNAYRLTKRVSEHVDYAMTGYGDRVQKIGGLAVGIGHAFRCRERGTDWRLCG